MDFRGSVIVFGAFFPHPEIGSAVSTFYIVHEILDKCYFILEDETYHIFFLEWDLLGTTCV